MDLTKAVSGLKQLSSLVQGFNQLKTEAEVAQKTLELNRVLTAVQQDLFAAHAAYTAAISRINELEKELVRMENWTAEQQRYQLHQPYPGSFVYRVKPEMQRGEPIHDICAQCYQQGIKSILQFTGIEKGWHKYSCHRCGAFVYGENNLPEPNAIYLPEPDLNIDGCY